MYHIIYISTASHAMSQCNLLELLEKSRAFNQANNVTGVLLYSEGNFIQILEGEEKCLKNLYHRISMDSAHHRVITISEGEAPAREFSEWSMGFRDMTGSPQPVVPGFTAYMNTPNQYDNSLTQSVRYAELLAMFKANLPSTAPS